MPYILSFVAMDISGHIRCRPTGTVDTQHYFADRPYFQDALARRDSSSESTRRSSRRAASTPHPVLPLALPIWNDRGDVVGVLAAALDLTWLGQKLKERTAARERLGDGRRPERHRSRAASLSRSGSSESCCPQEYMVQARGRSSRNRSETMRRRGPARPRLHPARSSRRRDIYVNVGLSTKAAFASINQAARRGFMLIAAALILALSLSALLSRAFITKPFEIVTSGIQAWRRGDYQARIDASAASPASSASWPRPSTT